MEGISMNYIDVFNLVLDSDDVTVGGGSASALAGAQACGLFGMVCKLSVKKDFGIAPEKQLELANELDDLKAMLLQGAVEDTKAFQTIKAAYGLPKETEEEKAARRNAVSDAGVVAATAPMENAKTIRRVYEIGQMINGKSNPNCHSDVVIGLELAKIGVNGCVMNIDANLSLIKDEAKVKEFQDAMAELEIK